MANKNQLNLSISDELQSLLDEGADEFNKKSRNQVAIEVLETYFEFWREAERQKRAVVEAQRAALGKLTAAGQQHRPATSRRKTG